MSLASLKYSYEVPWNDMHICKELYILFFLWKKIIRGFNIENDKKAREGDKLTLTKLMLS